MMPRILRAGRGPGERERGQILVMFGLGLIVFLGFAALTIDVGYLLVSHRSYQNAADASALVGATYLTRPISDPCADVSGGGSKHDCARAASWTYLRDDLRLALTDADINGPGGLRFSNTTTPGGEPVATVDGGEEYRIWVSSPPIDAGVHSTMSTVRDRNQVMFVRVDRIRSPFVMGVLGVGDLNVSAWATAGIFPNRFAVITLRRGQGSTEIDDGPANTTNIKTAGTNSSLTVVDGDVGGNWGMKLTAGSILKIVSTGSDEVNVYLIDYVSCGNSCWSSGQVQDENGVAIDPKKLPSFVPDPNYAPPPIPTATWPNGAIDNVSPALDIPNGDTAPNPFTGSPPSVTINEGDTTGSGGCVGPDGTEETAPRLGPGTYRDITVRNASCVILDPVRRFADPELGMDGELSPGDVDAGDAWEYIGTDQYPGIYYITGTIDIRNSALIVGDGVTVIIRPTGGGGAQFSPGSGGVMNLNTGKVEPTAQKLGGWTTQSKSPYLHNGTQWVYDSTLEADLRLNGVGLALYILKAQQAGITDNDGTDVIAVNSGAGLSWQGVTYAPQDNVAIAGQPNHDGIGQLISWTFTFNGGTAVTQTFDGPGDGFPYLIEPCIQVSGSCQ